MWHCPRAASVHHRDELERLQRELRELKGVSAIVYEQTCAAEKRRRRKRGLLAEPQQRILHQPGGMRGVRRLLGAIEESLSVLPLETGIRAQA